MSNFKAASLFSLVPQTLSQNERRRRFEDNLAAIFMGFVLVFLVCHFPRLALNIHELFNLGEAMRCEDRGRPGFSVWSLVLISISHFLLVVNSSTNILIYCLLSSKFREECALLLGRAAGWGRRRSSPEQQQQQQQQHQHNGNGANRRADA